MLPLSRIAEQVHSGRAKVRAAIRLAKSLGVIAIEAHAGREVRYGEPIRRVPLLSLSELCAFPLVAMAERPKGAA